MIEVKIKAVDGRRWSGQFDTADEADIWRNAQLLKPGRANAIHMSRDATQDYEYAMKERSKEYPTINEVIDVLMDNGIDSPEWIILKQKRNDIKAKYPIR